jgi:hypothetical protein
MHGDRCSQRTHRNGQVTAVHHVLTPVLVAPGNPAVMALQPECSTPPDGHAQPDWAQVAAQRWIARHAGRSPHVTSVGDDRSCQQPVCELWRHHDDHGLVVCQPEAHTTLYAWLAGVEAAGDLQRCTVRRWNGRFRTLDTSRDATAVPLRGCPLAWLSPCVAVPLRAGEDAWWVTGCALTLTQATDGTILYRHAFATQHPLDRTTVESVVQAGRARWNIEHEHNTTLKPTGYHREHHDGHGQPHLAAV